MNDYIDRISSTARQAVQLKDWATVHACANEILNKQDRSAEGHFLLGLAEKAANKAHLAIESFSASIGIDGARYDAAVELANQYLRTHRYGEAVALIRRHKAQMQNSPRYLDMAGSVYVHVGMPEEAWTLYGRANELQPGVDSLKANFAACSVYVGEIDKAIDVYRQLLKRFPNHQRNHYELSRLQRATNAGHVEQMEAVLQSTKLSPDKSIYLHYALGKELEDLERWDEAFEYYKLAGDAAASVSNYNVETDVQLIDRVIEICDSDWLDQEHQESAPVGSDKTPIFVVGLPRSGTTLTERILSCHSQIETVGESYFMQISLKKESGVKTIENMNAGIIEAAAQADITKIANGYLKSIMYKFGDKPMFIEKFPENFLYMGFIVKAFPKAKIIHLNRNPMDACFALYKQSFFRYAYSLSDLGIYYSGYKRLHEHWRHTLKDRLIELNYEDLVINQKGETRRLLDAMRLEFEESCMNFEQNKSASNTASTVQIREKIHTRSINKWKYFEHHLQPLLTYFASVGIKV